MEILSQTILPTATTILTGIISFFFYKFKRYEERRTKEEENKKIESQLREKKRNEAFEAVQSALLAICRDKIIDICKVSKQKKSISSQDFETLNKFYTAYHKLGGNGTVTAIYEKVLDLPLDGDKNEKLEYR